MHQGPGALGLRAFLFSDDFRRKSLSNGIEDKLLSIARDADFSWRCLRHSFCSRHIQNGVSLKAAQELMGHKVLAMTAR
jgi:site-specific recombinase XerD